MKILALFLLSFTAFAQSAVFPGAVVTDAQLSVAANNIQTLLTGSISSTAAAFGVVSATGMAANQIATIDAENVWICAVAGLNVSVGRSACPNVDGRGFDGSAAVAHSASGANCNTGSATGCVTELVVAWQHNAAAKEIEALEASALTRLNPGTPVASLCGAGPALSGNNNIGAVGTGSGTVNSCTLTFTPAFGGVPVCTVTGTSGTWNAYVSSVSTGVLVVGFSSTAPGALFYYHCY